ncbi:MAG: creatininase family protein [Bdellovibrionales bacterium]|nr:creatininase family protein [Bdellovibrionales bacterium]
MALWLEKMTADEFAALPRECTVIFFPVSGLEDHGPHLPMGLDMDESQALCRLAAERLEAEKPGWRAVIAPVAPLAVDSNTTNFAFPVRGYVLRDYLVDVGSVMIRQGFRYLVGFTGNAAPRQVVAIEEAGRILARQASQGRGLFGGFLRSREGGGRAALVSAQSGGTLPADLWKMPFGSDPNEHGGARDTSVALWLYQGTLREPKLKPMKIERPSSAVSRLLLRFQKKTTGYWGDPTKASVFAGESAVTSILDEAFPKLRAWFEGANPNGLFKSWYSVLPSNKTTFRAWVLAFAVAVIWLAYVYVGIARIGE